MTIDPGLAAVLESQRQRAFEIDSWKSVHPQDEDEVEQLALLAQLRHVARSIPNLGLAHSLLSNGVVLALDPSTFAVVAEVSGRREALDVWTDRPALIAAYPCRPGFFWAAELTVDAWEKVTEWRTVVRRTKDIPNAADRLLETRAARLLQRLPAPPAPMMRVSSIQADIAAERQADMARLVAERRPVTHTGANILIWEWPTAWPQLPSPGDKRLARHGWSPLPAVPADGSRMPSGAVVEWHGRTTGAVPSWLMERLT